jgi:hypothetical protein
MGLAQSAEAPDAPEDFDLTIDVELSPDALAPAYRTPGSGSFTIFAPRDAEIRAAEWNIVRTGLTFRLPFMLVISVDDHGPLMEVHRTLIDCEHEDELVLQMRHRAPRGSGPGAWHPVRRGDPIARGIVLPIARPEFRLFEMEAERV